MSEPLVWARPRRCNASTACVEVATDGERISIRSSSEPGRVLHYTRAEFAAFVDAAKGGEFDHLT
jgi:Domain of unknown function (DUF397)